MPSITLLILCQQKRRRPSFNITLAHPVNREILRRPSCHRDLFPASQQNAPPTPGSIGSSSPLCTGRRPVHISRCWGYCRRRNNSVSEVEGIRDLTTNHISNDVPIISLRRRKRSDQFCMLSARSNRWQLGHC